MMLNKNWLSLNMCITLYFLNIPGAKLQIARGSAHTEARGNATPENRQMVIAAKLHVYVFDGKQGQSLELSKIVSLKIRLKTYATCS